jgi:hypothetical protein
MSREQEVRDAVERFLAQMRQDVDTHLEALSMELLQIVRGDMRTSRTDLERAAIEVARAVAKGGSHARHDLISRVVVAIRRLDDATSLRGVLDALVDGASAEASRVAVLLVDQESFRAYRHHGFAAGRVPIDLPHAGSPLLQSAMTLRQATSVHPVADRDAADVPAFMRVAAADLGLVTPVVVGQAVVALVYAEGPANAAQEPGAPVWSEQVEVLVRHASSRLESLTSQRTVEVLTHSTS